MSDNLDGSVTLSAMAKGPHNPLCPDSPRSVDEEYIKSTAKRALRDFFQRVNVKAPPFVRDHALELRVREIVDSWGLKDSHMLDVISGCVIATGAYGHVSFELRVQLALYTVLVVALDDPACIASLAPNELGRQLQVPNPASVLGRLLVSMHTLWDFYPAFIASVIFTSSIRFVSVNVLDSETQGFQSDKSLPHVEYRRTLTGDAEAYSCFIWEKARFPDPSVYLEALPDVYLFVNRVNDLLSFYKEELAVETGNYITDRVRITQRPTETTLREMIEETIGSVERVRSILGEGPARDAWESFAGGYLNFHTCNPRYRLDEVLRE